MTPTSKSIAALMAAMLFFSAPSTSAQQSGENLPTVGLRPAETDRSDPNLGGWFVMQLNAGETGSSKARITNPASVPQHVKLYLADLVLSEGGTPEVRDGEQADVGAWGRFLHSDITVGARKTVDAEFAVTVPPGAEPGDHVGVVVAESDPESGDIKVVKRVATRIYVTVPGEAQRSMRIESLESTLESPLWPKRLIATVELRNTGRIRLTPRVSVSGATARGTEVLLASAVERYKASVPVPWYGGWVKLRGQATADGVPTAAITNTRFVFPWYLFLAVVLAGDIGFLVFRWSRKRTRRVEALTAEVARLEALVDKKPEDQPKSTP